MKILNNKYNELVSVIIPFFNNSKWLDEALESVYNQTIKPLEIIVINDGSNENIDNLKKKYLDTIFVDKSNGGAATARNMGIELARGKYCAFLDSDDLWKENKIEKQLRNMMDSGCKWSASGYEAFGIGKHYQVYPFSKKDMCYDVISGTCAIQTSTVMIESNILHIDKKARFAEDMRNGQDIYLWLYLANIYKICVVNEPLTKFRLRDNSTQFSIDKHIKVRAQLWDKMINGNLAMPKSNFTRKGYRICKYLYDKYLQAGKNIRFKEIKFGFAWALFRIGSFFSAI